jgi:(2Fe-2S) ferredoxin
MARQQNVPYVCHVFVCTNDRGGQRKACADGQSPALREALKEEVEKRGWRGRVRVSHCGCMGLCGQGPNVILYPQGVWFSAASVGDGEEILAAIEKILRESAAGG